MTKFPSKQLPALLPPSPYEVVVGYDRIERGYKEALRGARKYKREAVYYDLYRLPVWQGPHSGRVQCAERHEGRPEKVG